ncbi:hypothetical protein GCM10016234_04600 [Tianweitania populi]|uniref:Uncharacterized protein n=2 Tax=Phyllobacteriaceae TaxID=69277 RepID=A0A8J3DTZ2_9HYPH|nr:hypothetical protein GCM10016234_04600 [Tianweitania populi]
MQTGRMAIMEPGRSDIDAMIREEKRLTAVESHSEAWADGISAGIEPEIMAETALATALEELLRVSGDEAALALLERMRERVEAGEFNANQSRH